MGEYSEFFKGLLRLCGEYAKSNGIEINAFIERISTDINSFSENWFMVEDPIKEVSEYEYKTNTFVVGTKRNYSENEKIPLINYFQQKEGD
jgi:hypothetical protein